MPASRNDVEQYLESRFGIGEADLEPLQLVERNGDYWLAPRELPESLEIETAGLRAVRQLEIGLKPTTYFLQLMEESIERNVFSVDRDQLEKLMRREEMIEAELEEEGYVALEFEGTIVGCGFYRDGVVSSRVPAGRGEELADLMD